MYYVGHASGQAMDWLFEAGLGYKWPHEWLRWVLSIKNHLEQMVSGFLVSSNCCQKVWDCSMGVNGLTKYPRSKLISLDYILKWGYCSVRGKHHCFEMQLVFLTWMYIFLFFFCLLGYKKKKHGKNCKILFTGWLLRYGHLWGIKWALILLK